MAQYVTLMVLRFHRELPRLEAQHAAAEWRRFLPVDEAKRDRRRHGVRLHRRADRGCADAPRISGRRVDASGASHRRRASVCRKRRAGAVPRPQRHSRLRAAAHQRDNGPPCRARVRRAAARCVRHQRFARRRVARSTISWRRSTPATWPARRSTFSKPSRCPRRARCGGIRRFCARLTSRRCPAPKSPPGSSSRICGAPAPDLRSLNVIDRDRGY